MIWRSPDDRAQALLEARHVARFEDLAMDTGGGRPSSGVFSSESAMSETRARVVIEGMEAAVRDYQTANPLREGAPKASIATQMSLPAELLDMLLSVSDVLVDQGASVRTRDFSLDVLE